MSDISNNDNYYINDDNDDDDIYIDNNIENNVVIVNEKENNNNNSDDMIRVVMISDTHGIHDQVKVPDGDILIHAGDFTRCGNENHAKSFNNWLRKLPHKHKIVVRGNHEKMAHWRHETAKLLSNCIYLEHNEVVVENYKIYGFDFQWSCMNDKSKMFQRIPKDTNIIVAHNPPFGMNDGGGGGCKGLSQRIMKIKKKNKDLVLCVSGHIHTARGITNSQGIVFVNAANCLSHRQIKFDPIIIDLPKKPK